MPPKNKDFKYEPNFLVMAALGRVKLAISAALFEYMTVMVVNRKRITLVAQVLEIQTAGDDQVFFFRDPTPASRRRTASFITGSWGERISYFTIQH